MYRLRSSLAALIALSAVALGLAAAPVTHADGPRWRPHPWASRSVESACPDDMVTVRGNYCEEVDQQCIEWSDDGRGRCLRFAPPTRCLTRERTPMSFCMDRYEWPNREGMHPDVMVTFEEADSLCRGRGRRLCTEREWTFACEGEAMLPYPYGYVRDEHACTIDHFARAPTRSLLHDEDLAAEEAARVYEASASGSMPMCRSPYGAMDLTGNVDEWVVNESGWPYASSLMGGFWGHVRTRCRAVTRGHGPNFRYFQIGFRCCADAGERAGADRGIVATTP